MYLFDNQSSCSVYNNKFLQIGAGIGIDVTDLSFLTQRISRSITTGKIVTSNYNYSTIIGLGFKGDFVFHPIMKDYFSLGLLASGAVGSNPLVFTGWKKTGIAGGYTTGTEKYFYTRFDIGMEIAAGYSKLKALVIYRSSIQTHDYKKSQTDYANTTETNLNIQIRKEIVSAGIRVAPYSTLGVRYKRGFCFDFMYSLSRDYTWKWENFDWKYNALSGWQSGPGFNLWIQSILKLQFDALFNTKFDASYISSSTYDNKMYFQISLMYNRNAFY